MGITSPMRRELERRFFSVLQDRGFALDSRDAPQLTQFRRSVGEEVHILEIQWEKYGSPTFVINFGTCPASGLDTPRGHFPPEAVYVGWLKESGRLQPRRGHSSRNWFSQSKPWLQRVLSGSRLRPPEGVVDDLLGLFPEVEHYWTDGTIGAHVMWVRIPDR